MNCFNNYIMNKNIYGLLEEEKRIYLEYTNILDEEEFPYSQFLLLDEGFLDGIKNLGNSVVNKVKSLFKKVDGNDKKLSDLYKEQVLKNGENKIGVKLSQKLVEFIATLKDKTIDYNTFIQKFSQYIQNLKESTIVDKELLLELSMFDNVFLREKPKMLNSQFTATKDQIKRGITEINNLNYLLTNLYNSLSSYINNENFDSNGDYLWFNNYFNLKKAASEEKLKKTHELNKDMYFYNIDNKELKTFFTQNSIQNVLKVLKHLINQKDFIKSYYVNSTSDAKIKEHSDLMTLFVEGDRGETGEGSHHKVTDGEISIGKYDKQNNRYILNDKKIIQQIKQNNKYSQIINNNLKFYSTTLHNFNIRFKRITSYSNLIKQSYELICAMFDYYKDNKDQISQQIMNPILKPFGSPIFGGTDAPVEKVYKAIDDLFANINNDMLFVLQHEISFYKIAKGTIDFYSGTNKENSETNKTETNTKNIQSSNDFKLMSGFIQKNYNDASNKPNIIRLGSIVTNALSQLPKAA